MADQTNWARVLDEVDEETANLMIKLQLEDIESLSTDTRESDSESARQAYEAELRQYRAVRQYEGEETHLAQASAAAAAGPETEEARAEVADAAHQDVMLFDCLSCGDKFDADHISQVPCQHYYCDECLTRLFDRAMTDESLYPPRCCRQNIPLEDVSMSLPEDVRKEFERKQEELDDRHRAYCRVVACGTYIGYGHRDGDTGTCPHCRTTTCIHCSNPPHTGDCQQDVATQQLNELATREGWRRCTCRRMVELTLGCNHMT